MHERRVVRRHAIAHGWSRNVLVAKSRRPHKRAGKALTKFPNDPAAATIRPRAGDVKDPYVFDFLSRPTRTERDLERGLLEHVRDFLLELGVGFAFVGSQVHIDVGGEDFFVDLLFYHLRFDASSSST